MSARTIEAIDLEVGMTYRRFASQDWSTVAAVDFTMKGGAISGITITDREGGGCSVGAYATVQVEAGDFPAADGPYEGLTRCDCGAKYWDGDRCHSCGDRYRAHLYDDNTNRKEG